MQNNCCLRYFRMSFTGLLLLLGLAIDSWAETTASGCSPIVTSNEYDIRVARVSHAWKVDVEQAERVHFSHIEANMRNGDAFRKPSMVWGELEYMVRRYPNHLGALAMLDRLALMLKTDRYPGSLNSVDCHFQRALRFVPDDMGVKMLYGIYLLKRNRMEAAIGMFKEVEAKVPENANNHYNLGLAYLAAKKMELAQQQAILAYAGGFSLPGLKGQLRRLGLWGEAEEAAVKAASESNAAYEIQSNSAKSEADTGAAK